MCTGGSLDISFVPGCTIPGANVKTVNISPLMCAVFERDWKVGKVENNALTGNLYM